MIKFACLYILVGFIVASINQVIFGIARHDRSTIFGFAMLLWPATLAIDAAVLFAKTMTRWFDLLDNIPYAISNFRQARLRKKKSNRIEA